MKKNETLKELLLGIAIVGVLAQIVLLIFWNRHLFHAIGLWTGILLAMGIAIHMKRSIEDGLDLMGEEGVKYMKKAYLLRTAVACVIMAVVMYLKWGNPLTILLGVMTLKISVYMQPCIHNIKEKKKKGG